MPLYEYQCDSCGHRFELIQRFSDPPAESCTACGGGPVRKLLSSPAIQFKGSGWYITDYARKGSSDGKGAAANGDGAAAKTEKTDTTAAAKSDAPSTGGTSAAPGGTGSSGSGS